MSDLVKREITELAPNGSNYLSWSLDAEIVLDEKNLLHAIKPDKDKNATSAERAQALHFLRHHISSSLKNEYMTKRDPQVLWNALHERFEKMETVLLPRVKREWQNLRYQDYKTVEDYNAKLYGIVTRMKLCGTTLTESDLIEKTLSTFHPKLTYLSRQYKKEKYKKYIDLSNALQQDQGEDEELMQNHLTRPTSSLSKPEAHAVSSSQKNEGKGKGPQKAPWKGKSQKVQNFKKKGEWKSKKIPPGGEYGKQDQECYRCGMKGHWSRICRTPKHIVKLYQELKAQLKNNQHEAHFVSTKKLGIGECSKSKDKEESSKPEEKEEVEALKKIEDVPAAITSNVSWDVIMKNLEGMRTDMETDEIEEDVQETLFELLFSYPVV
ncbi:uncharacterized protein LOC8074976 [Sorghum bicolor]|jgi:hypothetical protein|uniref:uncharacterized protein LOC8074976 n=1 Tax=Sorghum bicolor TaxID=4558 RepID=UPI000B425523|nr:uncharacterized protein LOC8074976 [Sorghum bicolor]|eukprot:XP_002455742.2 uncharacterized protein LOC8074976 [Sorghum bicolor]